MFISDIARRRYLEAACIVSFLYDVAGRSEDAFYLTWDRIKVNEERAIVDLAQGKTNSKRQLPLTKRTVDLLTQLQAGG